MKSLFLIMTGLFLLVGCATNEAVYTKSDDSNKEESENSRSTSSAQKMRKIYFEK